MYPQTHFLFPFLIGLILIKLEIFSWKLAIISALIAVFIDIDHLIEHAIHSKKNKLSLRSTWNNIKYHKYDGRSFIHHWQGFVVITLILIVVFYINQIWALVLALAYYSHLLLDYNHLVESSKMLKSKVGPFFIRITYRELIFDAILILGIILVQI